MANQRPGALPQKTREMLEAAVLRAAITGQSNRDLAREFGVHYQTVQGIRRALKKQGVLDPKHGKSAQPKTVEGLMPWKVSDMAQFLKDLPNMRALTDVEKVNLLSHMALHESGPTKVQAVKALEDLQTSIAARRRIELELPATREEKLERLRRMCEVVGRRMWLEALLLERSRARALEHERLVRKGEAEPGGGAADPGTTQPLVVEMSPPASGDEAPEPDSVPAPAVSEVAASTE